MNRLIVIVCSLFLVGLVNLNAQIVKKSSLLAHNSAVTKTEQKLSPKLDPKTGKWGLATQSGTYVVPATLDYISNLENGYYTVYKMREIVLETKGDSTITDIRPFFGFIDAKGRYLVRPETSRYIDAYGFTEDGYALVTKLTSSGHRKIYVLNTSNEELEF